MKRHGAIMGIANNMLTWIIVLISVFVLVLLLYVMLKFNEKSNPNPTKTTHNTLIEVAWTHHDRDQPQREYCVFQDINHSWSSLVKTTGVFGNASISNASANESADIDSRCCVMPDHVAINPMIRSAGTPCSR